MQVDNGTETNLTGMYIDLLVVLMDYMNFTVKLTSPEDGAYGMFDNKTKEWSGIVGMLNSSLADFSILALSVTNSRSQGVEFTPAIQWSVSNLFIAKPKASYNFKTFAEVFNGPNFKSCMVAVSLACVLGIMVIYCTLPVNLRLRNGVAYVLLSLVGLDSNMALGETKGLAKRTLVLTICLFGLFSFQTWNAGLTRSGH